MCDSGALNATGSPSVSIPEAVRLRARSSPACCRHRHVDVLTLTSTTSMLKGGEHGDRPRLDRCRGQHGCSVILEFVRRMPIVLLQNVGQAGFRLDRRREGGPIAPRSGLAVAAQRDIDD